MLVASLKMNITLKMAFPILGQSKKAAEAEMLKPGAKETFSAALFAAIKESVGDVGEIDLTDVDVTISEV